MMIRAILKKRLIIGSAVLALTGVIALVLYLCAQSLVGNVVEGQLRQAGFPQADVCHVRLYLDGIVIGQIRLNDRVELRDVFTPQSAPNIAKNGLHHVIIKQWQQHITSAKNIIWPFPAIEDISVEDMQLHMALPQHNVVLSGTLKSLQPDADHVVLILPFETQDDTYNLQGKLEVNLGQGRLVSADINLDDGGYQTADVSLKRLSGWLNAQLASTDPQVEAQFMAGSVLYNGQPYADGMVQYSYNTDGEQWTVTLNRPADAYFNTWVIKPTADQRFAIQIATQSGKTDKSAVMISAAPLRLEPLLPAQP